MKEGEELLQNPALVAKVDEQTAASSEPPSETLLGVSVTLSDATIYAAPTVTAAPFAVIKQGTAVDVIGREDIWVKIRAANVGAGWTMKHNINPF